WIRVRFLSGFAALLFNRRGFCCRDRADLGECGSKARSSSSLLMEFHPVIPFFWANWANFFLVKAASFTLAIGLDSTGADKSGANRILSQYVLGKFWDSPHPFGRGRLIDNVPASVFAETHRAADAGGIH